MVVGNCVSEDNKLIEWVSEFPYLVSLIADNGKIDVKVEKRIASASKAFEAMRHGVFKDPHRSLDTKDKCTEQVCCLRCFMVVTVEYPSDNT